MLNEKMTERKVREYLGERAINWSPKGIRFLGHRLRGYRWNKVAENALDHYVKGQFDELVGEELLRELHILAGDTEVEEERLIVWALGRPTTRSRSGRWQERNTGFNTKKPTERALKRASEKLKWVCTPLEAEKLLAKRTKADKPKKAAPATQVRKQKAKKDEQRQAS